MVNLSRQDAELVLRRYIASDAPPLAVILLSRSGTAIFRRCGRLSVATKNNALFLRIVAQNEDDVFFPLERVRAQYAAKPPLPLWASESDFTSRFESSFCLVSASGERLYVYERKQIG